MGNTTLFKGKITGYHTSDSSRWWPDENGRTVKQGWSGASCVSDTTGVLWVVYFGSGTKWMGLQKNSANLTSLIVNLALGWHSICATTEYGASFPSLSLTVWLQFVCIKTLAFFCVSSLSAGHFSYSCFTSGKTCIYCLGHWWTFAAPYVLTLCYGCASCFM